MLHVKVSDAFQLLVASTVSIAFGAPLKRHEFYQKIFDFRRRPDLWIQEREAPALLWRHRKAVSKDCSVRHVLVVLDRHVFFELDTPDSLLEHPHLYPFRVRQGTFRF